MKPTSLFAATIAPALLMAAIAQGSPQDPRQPSAQTWETFRGPLGTGVSTGGLPPGDGDLGLELRWKRKVGSGYAGIAVSTTLMVTAFSAGERDVVAAFDRETGEERWRHDLAPIYKGHDGSHDGPITTPAIDDGRVFALGPWGHLAALDLDSGKALWTVHLVDDLGCEKPMYGFGGSPLVIGDVMILQIGGKPASVAGFDVKTGAVRWRSVDDDAWLQSPVAAEIAGRLQVLILGNETAAGIDPADGALLWSHRHGASQAATGALSASPLPIDGNRIFLKHDRGSSRLIEVTGSGDGYQARKSTEDRAMSKSYSPATLWGGVIYGYTSRFLSAFDPDSGKLLWKSRDPGDGFPVVIDGQLAILGKKGAVHLGPASREGWRETARLQVFDDVAWTPPSFADGALYLRSLGEIARVDLTRSESSSLTRGDTLPAPLDALAAKVAADGNSAAIDAFLTERELPLIDGDRVLFLWHGEARDVAVAGDMIGMRREEPMRRVPGTDLWWWQTELDPHARISYVYFVDFEPTVDPTHDRRHAATILGPDMNWQRGESLEMSWFAMPQWPGQVQATAAPTAANTRPAESSGAAASTHPVGPATTAGTADAAGASRPGRMETMTVSVTPQAPPEAPQASPIDVPIDIWLPPGYDDGDRRYPVVFVHHPGARQHGNWPATLDRVVGRSVAPLIAVFLGPGGSGRSFADQVAPRIDEAYRTRTDRDGRANVGMGWQSFVAATVTFANHDSFGRLGLQSLFALEGQMSTMLEAIGETTAETAPMKIYLEWGRWDLNSPHEAMNMRASSRAARDEFERRGWQPIGGEVWDSTDFASWRNRTALLLETLFPLAQSGPPEDLDRWLSGRR